MPFSDFYFLFKCIFKVISLLKSRKRVTNQQVMTWHAGPPRGCDAALRPRGKAAGGLRGAQEAHRARTRGRRPRLSTRTSVWGATWQGGRQVKGPWDSGP